MSEQKVVAKRSANVRPQQGNGRRASGMSDRNKRELVPNLSETHKFLTVVQFGDRAALLVRKRMSMTETGSLPASKALGLLEQYNTAMENYTAAVDAMCAVVDLDRTGNRKPADRKPQKQGAKPK